MKRFNLVARLLVAFCLLSDAAHASLFCIEEQGLPLQCIYDDANECRKRANQLHALCTANPVEVNIRPGMGKFCLLDSSRVSQCIYADRTSCENDAGRNGGVCIEPPSKDIQQNPYESDPNSKY